MFWLVILEGIWILYNFFTTLYSSIPFVNLIVKDFFLIDMLSGFALRWSLIIGIFLIIVGILGVVLKQRVENNLQATKIPAFVFGLIFSIFLIL